MNALDPILVVDDDDVDVMTVQMALDELSVTNPLARAADGEEALGYLRNSESTPPGLILIDLNMPRMNGIELLGIIKADEVFKRIPAVVLTTSSADRDVKRSFELGAAGYMLKPVGYEQFLDIMRTLHVYWIYSEAP